MGWSTSVVAGIWITCVAALFMAVGFSIPFWLSLVLETIDANNEKQTFNAYIGVWYAMACIKGEADSCKTGAIEPDFGDSTNDLTINGNSQENIVTSAEVTLGHAVWWWVLQIVTTIALGFVLLATLILICCRCAGIHSKGFFIISAILLFLGGLLSLIISVLTAIGIGVFFKFVDDVDITAETFPWSVLCFGLGGLLAMVASMILMYVTCNWNRLGKYRESDEDSAEVHDQQMSNLSKSYDRPRKYDGSRNNYDYDNDRRYDQSRDFSSSKKYRETRNDYPRDYSQSRDNTRDNYYSRSNQAYEYSDRGYEKSNRHKYDYDYDRSKGYSQSRPGDNMYRPYDQYKY